MTISADSIERELRSIIRGDVEFDPISRHLYSTDAGITLVEPLGVVSPRDTEDVAQLVTYAAAHGLPLVPRGMGSGLAGGAVGAGIQVDFSRYMTSILEVAQDGSWVRVQPGVVMASLNQYLRTFGTFFAPDPSSENYCSLGGMIGTNSSGARSVAYGSTKDHVLALETVLADGSRFSARPITETSPEFASFMASKTTAGSAFASILPELRAKQETIRAGMPRVVKNCSGYRIETIYEAPAGAGDSLSAPVGDAQTVSPPAVYHLQKMFVGAEGTLGLVTEATLNLVPLPGVRGIAMAYFPSVFASGEAIPDLLALNLSAVEIMDSRFLAFVRKHDSRIDAMLPDHTDTALLIEFEGRGREELDEKFFELGRCLDGSAALKLVRAVDGAEAQRLWTVRKSAVALSLRMPGPRRPLPFIEDVTVHPSEVPGYVDFLQRLLDREKVEAVMYGHVGDGNIHARPLLDAKDLEDLRTMQRIYEEVSDYVLGVRGTMSGEHGDGLLRTPYVQRMYGEEIYSLFAQIKRAFDPDGVMNPGKKIAPQEESGSLLRALRYGPEYRTTDQEPLLHFPSHEYEREIEKCHGCGQCKSMVATTMCPTYKATRREHASPRAKANLLRSVISGALDPASTYGLAAAKAVTDYCIVCGMCAVECPSNVNIPKLMLEAKSKYREVHRGNPVELILGRPETVSRLASLTAPLSDRLISRPLARRLAEPLTGIDRRRVIAPFVGTTFREMNPRGLAAASERRTGLEQSPAGGSLLAGPTEAESLEPAMTVAYFYDLFALYNDPELALAAVRVLAAHGIRVLLPEQRASGIPEMLYGYARRARETARFNVRTFAPVVRSGVIPVSTEPTASFAFKVHYPDYVPSEDSSLVANAFRDLGAFLTGYRSARPESSPPAKAQCRPGGESGKTPWSSVGGGEPPACENQHPRRIAYHQPCHLKAQQIGSPALELMREIPDLEIVDLDAGCCGMAGTFGMKRGTFDLSMRTGAPLFERIADVSPTLVASECSTCRMQISQATGLETVHPVTLLDQAYR